MRIALVRKEFSTQGGGAERYATNLANALLESGHEVHVFAHRYDLTMKGIKFHHAPAFDKFSALKNWSFVRSFQKVVSQMDFDIVHGLSQVYPLDIYRMGDGIHRHWLDIKSNSAGARLFHRVSLRHQVVLHIEKNIFKPGNFKRIIANSSLCRDHAIEYYGVPPELIHVVYNGIDFSTFNDSVRLERNGVRSALGIGERETVVLFSGMNFARKGLASLLRAVSASRCGKSFRLVILGKGRSDHFTRLARKLGLADRVVFCGFRHDQHCFYGAADIFVLPTHYDPCANVCLEAMACGLPVVTTRQNGASELIRHGTSGLVMESPEDITALAQWLEMLQEPDLRKSMGMAAREQVRDLTIGANMDETMAIYEKVIEEKSR